MVEIVTNFENGVQIEEAPNSWRTIAPYVDVSLYGLTASGAAFYEISFVRKMYEDIVKKVIPTSLLLSNRELICFLVNNGYANIPLKEDEKNLCDFLRERGNNATRALFAEKLGWLDDELARKNKHPYVYVTPSKQYSKINPDLQIRYVENPNVYSQNMETAGKLKDWVDNIGIYVQHSPLLTLAVCMGLGAIVMKPCGIESFIVHIWAATSKGKTITELVGQSVSRKSERNILSTWDITKIGLMDKCSSFSDTLFILDEVTKFCDTPTKLQQMIYEATNGSGKITSFAYAKSVSRVDCHWTIAILSSGEKSITQILKEGNVKLLKGREVRCFEINALRHPDYFIFTSLPKKMKDSAKLAKKLEENSRLYYGTPARKFLKEFLKDPEEHIKFVKKHMKKFFAEQKLEDGNIKGRIADRFAFMEAVGLLAVDFGILPMEKSKVQKHILPIVPPIALLKEWSASKVRFEPVRLPLILAAELLKQRLPEPLTLVSSLPDKSILAFSLFIAISPEVKLAPLATVIVPFVKSISPLIWLFPFAIIVASSPFTINLIAFPSISWLSLVLSNKPEFSFITNLPPVILTLPVFSLRISI